MKESGSKIICMAKVFISGLMVDHTKVIMRMMNNMDTAFTRFLMDAVIRACGKMVSSTVKASSYQQMAKKPKVPGIKASVFTISPHPVISLLDKVLEIIKVRGQDPK